MVGLLTGLWLCLPHDVEPAAPRLAVLPVTVKLAAAEAASTSLFLTNGLAAALPEFEVYDVISMDEVQTLLSAHAERERLGCDEPGCWTEIAGALDAPLMALGTVEAAGGALLWSQRLVDRRTEQVVRSVSVLAGSMQGLLAQIREVAAELCGRAEAVSLRGESARRRLGFTSAADLRDFRRYREAERELSTSEALTRYIIARNVESDRLALAEAGAFGTAAALTALVAGLPLVGGALAAPTGTLVPAAVLAVPSLLLAPLALAATGVGVALVVVDALNLRRVSVRRDGCCRQDADIRDAEDADGLRMASALGVLAGGPLMCGSLFVQAAVAQVLYSALVVALRRTEPVQPWPEEETLLLGPLLLCVWGPMPCLVLAQVLVIGPTGLALLLWPSPSAIEDAP